MSKGKAPIKNVAPDAHIEEVEEIPRAAAGIEEIGPVLFLFVISPSN